MIARPRLWKPGRVVIGASLALVASTLMMTGASAAARRVTATAPAAEIGYAINQPLCPTTASPGHVTCFALRRVPVKKGTAGARPYLKSFAAAGSGVAGHAFGPGPAGGYTPADLAAAYGYDPTISRSGQLVGIVDWFNDPEISSDLATFDSHYGLRRETARSFRVVNEHGTASPLPSSSQGRQSAGEIALDVETVRAVCHTCRILLVEATTSSEGDVAAAENTAVRLGATEVSNSFGGPEDGSLPTHFVNAFNHPGVVITAASGDNGWYDWDYFDYFDDSILPSGAAEYPSTDPHVVAVGGTSVQIDNSGTITRQAVWNENGLDDVQALDAANADPTSGPLGASGGGCSVDFPAPAWQQAVAGYSVAGCGGERLVADVSAIGDPETGFAVYDTWGRGDLGWVTIGGTSLSSPFVAAMFALAGGSGGAAYPAQSVYNNVAATPSLVSDITEGGNGFCGGDTALTCSQFVFDNVAGIHTSPNALGSGLLDCSFPRDGSDPASPPAESSSECNATTGFDGPSGLGAPTGTGLFASTSPKVSLTRPSLVRLNTSVAFVAKATEKLSTATITGVSFAWGDGQTTSGTALTASHAFASKGTHVVTLTVSDSAGQTSVVHSSITVGAPLSIKVSAPKSAKHQHRVAFRATAVDHNTGGQVAHIRWSWGDRATSSGAQASHAWRRAGTYHVTVTVADNTGVTTSHSVNIRIK